MLRRVQIFTLFGFAMLVVNCAFADPEPDAAPRDATVYQQVQASGGYRVDRLGAQFFVEFMYIQPNNQMITFWGARIVQMDPTSPLTTLGLQVGDVITRLDGMRISTNMQRAFDQNTQTHYWKPIQMDKHYGMTEVRYIRTGTHQVQIGTVNLGPLNPNPQPGGPVLP